ncbi:diguanylate cyclase (GGDEF domain) with PAS/PAC sensor [Grimontia sp. AD028]|uniref:sensor domain-containing diguanylate cyclase n=1 Tax=Grimontia sp. AD028 TaxID=1581149 RepID=UPI00061B46EB|nr:diguanylate cyclase [Grimontia sp. AD028]KKD59810.1 diguanylate cyclase (GGDEF domain) with PAS/PAC sensor [Grimontia sp. AD028]
MFQTDSPFQMQFFELAPVPMVIINDLGEIIQSNRECQQLFQIMPDEANIDGYLSSATWNEVIRYFQVVSQAVQHEPFTKVVRLTRSKDTYIFKVNLLNTVPSNIYIVALTLYYPDDELNEALQERLPMGMARVDTEGRFISVNPAYLAMLGYQDEEIQPLTEFDLTYHSDANSEKPLRENLSLSSGNQYRVDKRYLHKNGHQIWVRTFVSSITCKYTNQHQFLIAVLDIHEEKQLQEAITTSERRFRAIAENVSSVVWISAADPARLFYVNKCYDTIWEEKVEVLYHDPRAFLNKIHPSEREMAESTRFSASTDSWNINYRLLFDDGRVKHIRDSGNCVFDGNGELIYRVGTLTDITAEIDQRDTVVVMAKKLREMVEYDSLTGIKSRHAIMTDIQEAYQEFDMTSDPSVLVYIDADGFKNINDSYGHDVGDKVLKAIAGHLTSNIRDSDVAGRIGGDEFVVLLRHTATAEIPHILERLKCDIESDGLPEGVNVSISLGAIELSEKVVSAEQWLSEADKTMYQHKRSRKKMRLSRKH